MVSIKKGQTEQVYTNRKFAEGDKIFKEACVSAKVKPTVRQASKYRMSKGLAFKNRVQLSL